MKNPSMKNPLILKQFTRYYSVKATEAYKYILLGCQVVIWSQSFRKQSNYFVNYRFGAIFDKTYAGILERWKNTLDLLCEKANAGNLYNSTVVDLFSCTV